MIHGYYWQINVTAHCYGLFLSVEGTTEKLNAIFNAILVNKQKIVCFNQHKRNCNTLERLKQ